jgi:hypothetical protein
LAHSIFGQKISIFLVYLAVQKDWSKFCLEIF